MTTVKNVSRQALDFLEEQRLPPIPSNYQVAFAFEEGVQSGLVTAIRTIIDGGVRLTQGEADGLYAQFYGRAGYASPYTVSSDAVRHHTLRVTDLALAARDATGDLNRELSDSLPDLSSVGAAGVERLVVSMLEKTRATEDQLASTTAELNVLREKLEAVQGDAERDALTGLPNRRGIDAHLAARRDAGTPTAVALCDIDRFKSYNDRYGHAVGDRVLKAVATSLKDAMGAHFVGRWGGEEFLIVADAPLAETVALVTAAKAELGDRHFRVRETDEPLGRITFSAGVSSLTDDIAATLERADVLLYRAKNGGRDSVIGE
jgi:diguanylate cyclase